MGRPQGHVPAGQLRLPLRPGGAQEGAHLVNVPLGSGPAQVGGGPHRTGEGRLHGVHPVVQPHQKGQDVGLEGWRPHPLRPLRRGAGHGQAGIGRPVAGQGGPQGGEVGLRGAEYHHLGLGGDGVVGEAPGEGGDPPAGQPGQKRGQQLDRVGPAPVDVVAGVATPAAREGEPPGGERRGRPGVQRGGPGLPPSAGRAHHRPAQVKAVGVEQVFRPCQPVGRHLLGPLQPHLLGGGEDQAQGPVVHRPGGQEPQRRRVAQVVVRPQGGAAVRAEEAPLLHHRYRVGEGVPAAARPDGAHHVQVALEDQAGGAGPARRGGHVGHPVARPVPDRGEAQPPQVCVQLLPGGLLVPGGPWAAGEDAKGVYDAPGDGLPAPQALQKRHMQSLLSGVFYHISARRARARPCLKNSNMTSGEEFCPLASNFFAGILADFKEKLGRPEGKRPGDWAC